MLKRLSECNLGPGKYVMVHWIDSASQSDWLEKDDIDLEPAECTTIGKVVKYLPGKYVVMAATESDGFYHDVCAIPVACIEKIEQIEVGKSTHGCKAAAQPTTSTERPKEARTHESA